MSIGIPAALLLDTLCQGLSLNLLERSAAGA